MELALVFYPPIAIGICILAIINTRRSLDDVANEILERSDKEAYWRGHADGRKYVFNRIEEFGEEYFEEGSTQ